MSVSKRLRYEIMRRDNHTCRYCGESAPRVKLTIDHVAPVSLGGSDEPSNLVAACPDCNAGKAASNPDAPLVADVSEKAIQWAKAIERAALNEAVRLDQKQQLTDYFYDEWHHRNGYQQCHARQYVLPADWEETAWRFYQLGLNVPLLDDAIDIAQSSRAYNKFKYFCGVCWTKVRALQDQAFEMVEASNGA